MEKRKITNIGNYVRRIRYIGSGSTAHVYLTPEGEILKVYKDDDRVKFYSDLEELEERLEYLHEVSNDTYLGPSKLVTCNDKLVGYTMPYAKGNTLMNMEVNSSLSDFCNQISKLNEDTFNVTSKGLVLLDCHDENAMYSIQDGFKIIDLDCCTRVKYSSKLLINFNNDVIKNIVIKSLFKIPYGKEMCWFDSDDRDFFNNDLIGLSDILQALSLKYLDKENPNVKELVKSRSKIVYRKGIFDN